MSLIADKIFYDALKSTPAVIAMVGKKIHSTDIPVPDDEYLNEPAPFIVIIFDGMQTTAYTKDNWFEGIEDLVTIRILLTAKSRDQLGVLSQLVRQAIADYFNAHPDHPQLPDDMSFSASEVNYDPYRPAYELNLVYQCSYNTNP